MKQGLVLDKVVLLGRTLDEYRRYFALDLDSLRGKTVLDVASGVSSFCAEANQFGLHVTAFDAIYELDGEQIRQRCEPDLDHVTDAIRDLKTYRWGFYESPEKLRVLRERAYKAFLADYHEHDSKQLPSSDQSAVASAKVEGSGVGAPTARYVHGLLPKLPFADGQFDLTLVSYLLFVYEDQFDYEFHRQSLLEIMRVTRGEARMYPLVSFEAVRCSYLDRIKNDPALSHFGFEEVQTDFEFLANSNYYLRVFRR